MSMSRWLVVLLICSMVGLAACGAPAEPSPSPEAEPEATATTQSEEAVEEPTPEPTEEEISAQVEATPPNSPLPAPTPTITPTPPGPAPDLDVPTPAPGKAVVHGEVYGLDQMPVADAAVRLGELVWFEGYEGEDGVVISDRLHSPQSLSDPWGRFIISDLDPDKSYGVFVQREQDQAPIALTDGEGGRLLVEPEPDEVVDLGRIGTPLVR